MFIYLLFTMFFSVSFSRDRFVFISICGNLHSRFETIIMIRLLFGLFVEKTTVVPFDVLAY